MAVAFDATTQSNGTGDASFTHTPAGTPRAAIVAIAVNNNVDSIVDVTYGGVSMTRVVEIIDATTTTQSAIFFLDNVAAGAQTVVADFTAAVARTIDVVTVTADGVVEVVDSGTATAAATASPSGTLTNDGRSVYALMAFGSTSIAVTQVTPLTGWADNVNNERDLGSEVQGAYDEFTTDGQDVTFGFTNTGSGACACAAAIIAEALAAAGGNAGKLPRGENIGGTIFADYPPLITGSF